MITKIILLSLQILLSFAFIPLQNVSREYYTTQANDTLLLISEKMYSDQDFWPIIYAANKENLSSDPQSLLQEDLNFRIPPSSLCQEFDFPECRDKARSSFGTQTYSENFCLNDIPRPQDSIRSFKLTVYNQLVSSALEGPQRYVQKGKVEQIPDDIRPNGKDIFLVSQGSDISTYGVISYPIVGDFNKLSVMWSVPRSPFVENYISVYYGPESAGPELLDAMYKDKLSKATSSKNTWTTYQLSDELFADVSMTDSNACNGTVRIYNKVTVLKDGVYVIHSKNGYVFESRGNSLVHSNYNKENLAQRFYVKNAEKVCDKCVTITNYVSHKILVPKEDYLGFGTFSGKSSDFWSIFNDRRGTFRMTKNSGNFRVEDLSFELIE